MPISEDVRLGEDVVIRQPDLVNLYGCSVGDQSKIGAFVEIQRGAAIGRRCKISSHSFVCDGVTIEDDVFIGHGVMFTNDRYPRATAPGGQPQTESDWLLEPTLVRKGASIGTGATVLPGVRIGLEALVGAGSVVTANVPDYAVVVGVPARIVGDTRYPKGGRPSEVIENAPPIA
jgi:acetyltransferase-like isoleucine patch superfamily enzyme